MQLNSEQIKLFLEQQRIENTPILKRLINTFFKLINNIIKIIKL